MVQERRGTKASFAFYILPVRPRTQHSAWFEKTRDDRLDYCYKKTSKVVLLFVTSFGISTDSVSKVDFGWWCLVNNCGFMTYMFMS